MSRIAQIQIFLFVLVLGFLTGPRVIQALQGFDGSGTADTPVPVLHADITNLATALPDATKTTPAVDPYANLALHAKSAYVWDINAHKKLFAINSDARLPLASVAKIMMALVATESLPPKSEIVVSGNNLLEEGDTGLLSGEKWALDDLIQFTLTASSNDGASAIAETVGHALGQQATPASMDQDRKKFLEKMNQKAEALGLYQTSYESESGLDVSAGRAGAYGSARDMAMLFEYVFRYHPTLFTSTAHSLVDIKSESGIMHHIENTNQDVDDIPGIIGSKTGFTNLAGGNLVIVANIGVNHPVVIAVLGSTREDRFTDVKQLITATTNFLSETTK